MSHAANAFEELLDERRKVVKLGRRTLTQLLRAPVDETLKVQLVSMAYPRLPTKWSPHETQEVTTRRRAVEAAVGAGGS